jgi:hypothetical protein
MDEEKLETHRAKMARLRAARHRIDASVPKKVRKHAPLGIWLRKEKGKK